MKRWLPFLMSVSLAAGCTRYTPVEGQELPFEETGAVYGYQAEAEAGAPREAGAETSHGVGNLKRPDAPEKTGAMGENAVSLSLPGPSVKCVSLALSEAQRQAKELGEAVRAAQDQRTPVKVKGIYVTAYVAGNREMMEHIISRIDGTELNAVVIDFKTDEGHIAAYVDSPVFEGVDACRNYIPDLPALMDTLKSHGIYTIARIVAFRDPWLSEKRPDVSLKRADGSVYRDRQGLSWVNPYKREVWDYLVEAGRQAAAAGFDEVQFDYIRFSTDSTMREVVFDEADTLGRSRTDVITEFAGYAYERLAPLGLFVSADVFGAIIGSGEDAAAVGQSYGAMADCVDYICPMIYPSHYGDGNFGLDHPDLHPYETISGALNQSSQELSAYREGQREQSPEGGAGKKRGPGDDAGKERSPEVGAREEQGGESQEQGKQSPEGKRRKEQALVRPWLQDFTAGYLRHHRHYGDKELREQIQAVYDAGYEEWILWNASNQYHYGGLLNESDAQAGGEVPAF